MSSLTSIEAIERRLSSRIDALEQNMSLLKDEVSSVSLALRSSLASAKEAVQASDAIRSAHAAASTRAEAAENALARCQRERDALEHRNSQLLSEIDMLRTRIAT